MILTLILDQKMVLWVCFSSVSVIFTTTQLVQNFGVLLNIEFHVDLCPKFAPIYNCNTIFSESIAIFILWSLKMIFIKANFCFKKKYGNKKKVFFSLNK